MSDENLQERIEKLTRATPDQIAKDLTLLNDQRKADMRVIVAMRAMLIAAGMSPSMVDEVERDARSAKDKK